MPREFDRRHSYHQIRLQRPLEEVQDPVDRPVLKIRQKRIFSGPVSLSILQQDNFLNMQEFAAVSHSWTVEFSGTIRTLAKELNGGV